MPLRAVFGVRNGERALFHLVQFIRTKIKQEPSLAHISRRSASTPGPTSLPRDRVVWLLENVWRGNRSEMARAIGVTHSVLTKIAAGQQNAGRRVLGAIASHPKVNPTWLLTGDGEPLLAAASEPGTEGWPAPIFRQLLQGTPAENRGLWSGESFPLPGGLHRESRYWLKILPNNPILTHPFARIRPYDLLLMETDPVWWKADGVLDERICAVVPRGSEGPELAIVRFHAETDEESAFLDAEIFSKQPDRAKIVTKITSFLGADGQVFSHATPMVRSDGKAPKWTAIRQMALAPVSTEISRKEITSACVLLLRQ